MREVILYGPMRAMFGRSHMMDVKSPAEALRALCAVLPGFRKWFNARARAGAVYHIFVGKRNIATGEVVMESSSQDPIRIAPTIRGSKSKIFSILTIIAGVALMAFTGNPLLLQVGIGLVINGVASLLVATPKAPDPNETSKEKPSQVYDGPVNATSPGNCIPVLYGTLEVGSVVVSGAIYTEDISPILTGANAPEELVVTGPRDPTDEYSRWNP